MDFTILPARLEFEAIDEVYFPTGQETNVFRSAFGKALRRVCTRTYARIFEPTWADGPSGYRNPPRPFVLRSATSVGHICAHETFSASFFLFDSVEPPWRELAEAFELAAASGLGPSRGRAKLQIFQQADRAGALSLPLQAGDRLGRLRLSFVTPTELKGEGDIRVDPDFPTLTHRLAERVWALGRRYQDWPPEWDYRVLLDLGRTVRLLDWKWDFRDSSRYSRHTGQRHSIGGFTGWAEYEGPVGAFLPLLEIGRWTGVGRQTVWGKGEIRVEEVRLS